MRRVLSVDAREDPARNLALEQHWFEVGASRLRRQGIVHGGLASYNLFAISERDFERVRQAHLDYYERLRGIVAESREPTRAWCWPPSDSNRSARALRGEALARGDAL